MKSDLEKEKLVQDIQDLLLTFDHKQPFLNNTALRIMWLCEDYFTKKPTSEAAQ